MWHIYQSKLSFTLFKLKVLGTSHFNTASEEDALKALCTAKQDALKATSLCF